MKIIVNDGERDVAAEATLTSLMAEMRLAERRGVAVSLNGTVVPRRAWPQQMLEAGDRVLVIQAAQGG